MSPIRASLLTILATALLTFLVFEIARAQNARELPPTFLSAVATYDTEGRFARLLVGSTRFLNCKDALEDTRGALEKAAEFGPAGSRAVGQCIPLKTFNDQDLIK